MPVRRHFVLHALQVLLIVQVSVVCDCFTKCRRVFRPLKTLSLSAFAVRGDVVVNLFTRVGLDVRKRSRMLLFLVGRSTKYNCVKTRSFTRSII